MIVLVCLETEKSWLHKNIKDKICIYLQHIQQSFELFQDLDQEAKTQKIHLAKTNDVSIYLYCTWYPVEDSIQFLNSSKESNGQLS